MHSSWPPTIRATPTDQAERRVAISLHALVMLRWRRDHEQQRTELRKIAPEHGRDDS